MKSFSIANVILVSLLSVFFSCSNDSKIDGDNFLNFFFPMDSVQPYILAYQNVNDPLDEKFLRLYTMQEQNEPFFFIERYNQHLKITEGFKLIAGDSLRIVDHMIVDVDGLKRQANLSDFYYFPTPYQSPSRYISDFPYLNDTIVMVYESKKHIANTDTTVRIMGRDMEAILVVDTITSRLVNRFTKEILTGKDWVYQLYAKDIGLVRFGSKDGALVYQLTGIYSDAWWYEVAMSPQVRF